MRKPARIKQLETKWIALFDELYRDLNLRDRIAAPFLSVPAEHARSILYVGKATSGPWYKNDFCATFRLQAKKDANKQIDERRQCTQNFLRDEAPTYGGGFWPFARKLNLAAARKWNSKAKIPLQHIAWTNICKIGTVLRNPEGHLFEVQRSLAIDTLRLEIELYKPRLICFVTWDYKFDLVKEVLGDPSDAAWDQTRNEGWLWWRVAKDKLPPILLIGHPQAKPRQCIEEWVTKVSKMLPT
jgi:hypothetical protein